MIRTRKIGLISNWGGNIGHEFITTGVEIVSTEAFKDSQIEFVHIERHYQPFKIYPVYSPIRLMNLLPWGWGAFLKRAVNYSRVSTFLTHFVSSWISELDLAIACGGPVITLKASHFPEICLMFNHFLECFKNNGVNVLNLGIGSCYPIEKIPQEISRPEDMKYLTRMFLACRDITVRDDLARNLCAGLHKQYSLIPCPSILSSIRFQDEILEIKKNDRNSFIVLNILEKGANEDWGQDIDPEAWFLVCQNLVRRLLARHEVRFVCHSEREYRLAEKINSSVPRFQPRTVQEYFRIIAGAKVGLCNRIHAAMPLASLGVPSVGVGTDTRLKTLETVGLPVFYVKEVTVDLLEEQIEQLLKQGTLEFERLRNLRDSALQRYVKILKQRIANK